MKMRDNLKQIIHDMRFNVFTSDTMTDYLINHNIVPVVHCKDCKYLKFSDFYGECDLHCRIVKPNDFCSCGVKKVGD